MQWSHILIPHLIRISHPHIQKANTAPCRSAMQHSATKVATTTTSATTHNSNSRLSIAPCGMAGREGRGSVQFDQRFRSSLWICASVFPLVSGMRVTPKMKAKAHTTLNIQNVPWTDSSMVI